MVGASEVKPGIVVDSYADVNVAHRIQLIDRTIHEKPGEFLKEFVTLGVSSTEETSDFANHTSVPSIETTPDQLIKEFFRNRNDFDSSYDAETEAAIASDSEVARLLQISRSTKSERVQRSMMESELRANPNANAARDAVRRARFGVYLTKVAEYYGVTLDRSAPESQEAGAIEELPVEIPQSVGEGVA